MAQPHGGTAYVRRPRPDGPGRTPGRRPRADRPQPSGRSPRFATAPTSRRPTSATKPTASAPRSASRPRPRPPAPSRPPPANSPRSSANWWIRFARCRRRYARDGKLDEALAIRARVRQLRGDLLGVRPDPGNLTEFTAADVGRSVLFEVVGRPGRQRRGAPTCTRPTRGWRQRRSTPGVLREGERGLVRVTLARRRRAIRFAGQPAPRRPYVYDVPAEYRYAAWRHRIGVGSSVESGSRQETIPTGPRSWPRSSPTRTTTRPASSPPTSWRSTATRTGPRSSASRCNSPPRSHGRGQEPGGGPPAREGAGVPRPAGRTAVCGRRRTARSWCSVDYAVERARPTRSDERRPG